MAPRLQVLDEQAPGPLDRDRQPAPEAAHLPIQLGQARDIMRHPELLPSLARLINHAQLVMLSAPVDPGKPLPARAFSHPSLLRR